VRDSFVEQVRAIQRRIQDVVDGVFARITTTSTPSTALNSTMMASSAMSANCFMTRRLGLMPYVIASVRLIEIPSCDHEFP